jgi:hypothetical protein
VAIVLENGKRREVFPAIFCVLRQAVGPARRRRDA